MSGYGGVAPLLTDEQEHRRQIAAYINSTLNQGKFNCTVGLTLTASSATTTLIDPRIGYDSFISFMPETANAAAALSSIYVTGKKQGQATINHANNANADKTFLVAILG